jgi:hypothetical protein
LCCHALSSYPRQCDEVKQTGKRGEKRVKKKTAKVFFYIAQWTHLVQFTFGINNETRELKEDFPKGDLYT